MKQLLLMAWQNIAHAKKRSYLTMIGILIGITAVVALISLGYGLQEAVIESFEEIGSDKLFIMPDAAFLGATGDEQANPLTTDDVEALKSVRGVEEVGYYSYRSAQMEFGNDFGFYYLAGVPVDDSYDLIRQISTADLLEGRELRPGDTEKALIGNDYTRRAVFQDPLGLGDRVEVNGVKFTVVGILESIGSAPDDRTIWVPIDSYNNLMGTEDIVDSIIVRTSVGEDPLLVSEDVERRLRDERDLDEGEEDYSVQTPDELLESFNVILQIIQVVLVGIALISLVVGGVGIMNTMYTAVLERTKEIGIMKSIGATPKVIRTIFILESGILGFLGGLVGTIIGIIIAKLIEGVGRVALNTAFINAYLSIWLILGALAFSTLIGMLAGYLPARAASQQDPVESLRYE